MTDIVLGGFVDALFDLSKAGARHGKRDRSLVQDAHDSIMKLVDGSHCANGDKTTNKVGSRHSMSDMERIRQAHDLIHELGALCPGENEPMGEPPK